MASAHKAELIKKFLRVERSDDGELQFSFIDCGVKINKERAMRKLYLEISTGELLNLIKKYAQRN